MANPAPAVVLSKDFDPRQLFIDAAPQKNKAGGKYVRIGYGPKKATLKLQVGGRPPPQCCLSLCDTCPGCLLSVLQSPAVYLPFGVSSFEDDKGETTQSVECSLRGYDDPDNASMQAFYKALQAIDEAVLAAAEANATAWFGKEMPRALLQEFQRTLVKAPRDPKYAPLFKAKAVKDFRTGEFPKVFDAADKQTVLPLEYIVKGTSAKLCVVLPSIYLINKTFGISARLHQLLVTHRPAQEEGCLIQSDGEEDEGPDVAEVDDGEF